MAIYVQRITRVADPLPPTLADILNLNCLNFFPKNIMHNIPLYQITPYYLHDAQGHIFENIWQGSKVYEIVDAQHEIKAGKIIWSHPQETHVVNGQLTSAFWAWRKKLWNNPYAVRYPNGYHGRHKCLCALWSENDTWVSLPYIPARKKIYCNVYATLVRATEAYTMLEKLHAQGQNL